MAYDKLTNGNLGETSEKVRARIEAAREKQRLRFLSSGLAGNADMRLADVRAYCKLDDAGPSLIRSALSQLQMSARGFHRVLKLAPTIAELTDPANIQPGQLAEALNCGRPRRQRSWTHCHANQPVWRLKHPRTSAGIAACDRFRGFAGGNYEQRTLPSRTRHSASAGRRGYRGNLSAPETLIV